MSRALVMAVAATVAVSCSPQPAEDVPVKAATRSVSAAPIPPKRVRKVPVPSFRAMRASVPPKPKVKTESKWHPILMCESSGNWYETKGMFEGGLQFHPQTWDGFKPDGYPDAAYEATPEQQVYVAELVLAAQGWQAWPACSRKVGYR